MSRHLFAALLCAGASTLPLSAIAQIRTPQIVPGAQQSLLENRLETTRKAKLSHIMGVDTSDSQCGTYDPAGLSNPVIYRNDSGAGRHIELFAGDTGLVLIGDNLDLVEKVVLNYDPGEGSDITGTIVSRRNGNAACGEDPADKVLTVRLNIPVVNSARKTYGALELYAKTASLLKIPPKVQNPNDPCLPQNINLEAGLPPQCAPGYVPLNEVVGLVILPLPELTGQRGIDETDFAPDMARDLTVGGINLDQFTSLRLDPGNLSQAGGRGSISGSRFIRPTSPPQPESRIETRAAWEGVPGFAIWNFALVPQIQIKRQPRGGTARPFASSATLREVNDTMWGAADDRRRTFRSTRFAGEPLNFRFEMRARVNNPPPEASPIDGFDPGNRLYETTGGTTMVGNSPSESQQILTALKSKAWCSTLPVPAPGPNGARTVALGTTTLGPIQWGVKNISTTAFNGIITAELKLGGRTVDTLSFNGTLAAGGTQVKSYTRPTQTVSVARESLGDVCYHVGQDSDPVVENNGYTIRITTPGSATERLDSQP